MDEKYDYRRFSVLFVDDEDQARKYFDLAVAKTFGVLTASSVAEATDLLDARSDEIAIVVTDQRMPQERGVELLKRVKVEHPGIVRILTTAYSELEDAIEAVNTGAIYQYVTKPWELRDLRQLLMRGMEFFLVQRERDLLVREKLAVFHDILVSDRSRSLAVFAASQSPRLANSLQALAAFLNAAPEIPAGGRRRAADEISDVWLEMPVESMRMISAVTHTGRVLGGGAGTFGEPCPLRDVILRAAGSASGVTFELDAEPAAGRTLICDEPLLAQALQTLSSTLVEPSDGETVRVEARPAESVWGAPGVDITLRGSSAPWTAEHHRRVFAALEANEESVLRSGFDVLAAYFIAYHHGGSLECQPESGAFKLSLPSDPDASLPPALDPQWLERVFMKLQGGI